MEYELIRRVTFCAAHRLHSPHMSIQGNKEHFGKCNNIHGHNFVLEAVFKGDGLMSNGMVCNMEQIDRVLQTEIHDRFDHKYINEDVPPFNVKNNPTIPTCENMLNIMWLMIKDRWAEMGKESNITGTAILHKLILHETEKNVFEFQYVPKKER